MGLDITDANPSPALTQHLLLSIVEQLKLPLMNIARRAELAALQPGQVDISTIQVTADAALQLLDNYLLGVQLAHHETVTFEVEPVSIPSVLYDAGNQLRPFAKAYGVRLDLQVDGKYGTVMAHRRGLQAALLSLGYALVEALPAVQEASQLTLQLSAHRCRYGVVAGLYSTERITVQALRQGRQLYGRARQPLGSLSHASGAGVFVADAILRAMRSQLTVSHHHRLHGLGAVLPLNPQLQFV